MKPGVVERAHKNAYRIELKGESQRRRYKPPATRRRRRRQQSPGLKAGVHGRLRRLPGCKGGGARRHAVCESLPPRPAGRLHAQEASHTLGSGRPKASPLTPLRGGSHRHLIRERKRAGARPHSGQVSRNCGQIKSDSAVKSVGFRSCLFRSEALVHYTRYL